MSRFARLLAALIVVQLLAGVSVLARVPAEAVVGVPVARDSHRFPGPASDLAWVRSRSLDATPIVAHPAANHWAVIVGVNRYARAGDTLGSVADALVLRDELLRRGWLPENMVVLLDGEATGARVREALAWLARKADDSSTVVFSMSGHIRHRGGVSALWPTDSDYLWADEVGRLLAPIRGRFWASFQGCHAEGLRAPGIEAPGRVVTYSSELREKSYEDPEVGHSVMGNYLFREGFQIGWGDGDGDGLVSVQEAFAWAAPRAHIRSAWQQTPVIFDGLGEPFYLEVPSSSA